MITFQGRQDVLKSAKILESRARNTYPHISTSKIRKHIGYDIPDPAYFVQLKEDYSNMLKMIRESGDYYSSLIYTLSDGKMGNCTEDAMFTELLGKINGQKNIYTGCIGLKKDGGKTGYINHVVAFITDEPVTAGKEYFLKNKEAVIIDPWLAITDFASGYFTKLKTVFRKVFSQEKNPRFVTFSNDKLATELLKMESKTPQEYKSKRKYYLPKDELCLIPFIDHSLNSEKLATLKMFFPELTIKNFKEIKLPEKKENPGKKIKPTDYIA